MRKTISYSQEELAYIKANCVLPRKQLHAQFVGKFNRHEVTFDNIKSLCTRKGWNTGRNGRFLPGQASWNKGKTGYMGSNRTSFKKGMVPHNHKPVGSERVNIEGYVEVKVSEPNIWELKHRVVYEQHHSAIGKNENITFLDGDTTNCAPENLIKVTRSQALYLNRQQLQHHTGDAKKAAVTLAKLNIVAHGVKKRLAEA